MTKIFILIVIIWSSGYACYAQKDLQDYLKSQKPNKTLTIYDVVGYYVGRETHRTINLNIDGSYSILYDKSFSPFLPVAYTMDTLSIGTWKLEDNLIVLNSSKKINSNRLKVLVQEELIENFDSILFEIHNPYEDNLISNCSKLARVFTYSLSITTNRDVYGPEIKLKENKVCLKKYPNNDLVDLNIYIIPDVIYFVSPVAFNYLKTETYKFKNRKSNKIVVTIPNLTWEYFCYERYRDELVKAKKNTLILRDEKFDKNSDFFRKKKIKALEPI